MDYGDCLPIFISKAISKRYIPTIYIPIYIYIYFWHRPMPRPQQARHSHAMAWAIYPLRTSWMLSPCSASRRPEILKSSTHLKFMVSSCCCCSGCCCCCRLVVAVVAAALVHVAAGQHFSGFVYAFFRQLPPLLLPQLFVALLQASQGSQGCQAYSQFKASHKF